MFNIIRKSRHGLANVIDKNRASVVEADDHAISREQGRHEKRRFSALYPAIIASSAAVGWAFNPAFALPLMPVVANGTTVVHIATQSSLTKAEKMAIQSALKELGHYSSTIDGQFGPGTARAIKSFQESAGLAKTGELTSAQIEFLLEQARALEAKKLAAMKSRTNTPSKPSQSASNDTKDAQMAAAVGSAENRTFSGPYGGQWSGTVECQTNNGLLVKEIAMRIDGEQVFIDSFADTRMGDLFSKEGSITLEDGFFTDAGAIAIGGGGVTFKGSRYTWNLRGQWHESETLLQGDIAPTTDLREKNPCKVTFIPGVSKLVEIERATSPGQNKTDNWLSSVFGSDDTDQSDTSGQSSSVSNSRSNGSRNSPSILDTVLSAARSTSGSGQNDRGESGLLAGLFGGVDITQVPGINELLSEPPFNGRSSIETYIITMRLLHMATKSAASGIVEAQLALGLKTESDIPQYMYDVQASSSSSAFLKDVREQDVEVIAYSSEAVKELKAKLASQDFELSDETKAQLAKAHEQLSLAEIYQLKTGVGLGILSIHIDNANAMNELNAFLQHSGEVAQEIPAVVSNTIDFLFNFNNLVEIAGIIEDTKDTTGVVLLKQEFLESSANEAIDLEALNDLEMAAE
jgi:hypothetical protein